MLNNPSAISMVWGQSLSFTSQEINDYSFQIILWQTVSWNLFLEIKKENTESERSFTEDQQVTVD